MGYQQDFWLNQNTTCYADQSIIGFKGATQ